MDTMLCSSGKIDEGKWKERHQLMKIVQLPDTLYTKIYLHCRLYSGLQAQVTSHALLSCQSGRHGMITKATPKRTKV